MARYKVKERTFNNKEGVFYDEGDEMEFDGVPGTNLEAIDKDAKAAVAAAPPAQQGAVGDALN